MIIRGDRYPFPKFAEVCIQGFVALSFLKNVAYNLSPYNDDIEVKHTSSQQI